MKLLSENDLEENLADDLPPSSETTGRKVHNHPPNIDLNTFPEFYLNFGGADHNRRSTVIAIELCLIFLDFYV